MARKPDKADGPGKPGPKPESMLQLFASRAEWRPYLFGAVAERIRARLDPADAEIIAGWFDRLAAGEPPAKVFAAKRGRPRGAVKTVFVRGQEVKRPDDIDLCWGIRRAIAGGHKPGEVFAELERRFGTKAESFADLYRKTLPILGPDPNLPPD